MNKAQDVTMILMTDMIQTCKAWTFSWSFDNFILCFYVNFLINKSTLDDYLVVFKGSEDPLNAVQFVKSEQKTEVAPEDLDSKLNDFFKVGFQKSCWTFWRGSPNSYSWFFAILMLHKLL